MKDGPHHPSVPTGYVTMLVTYWQLPSTEQTGTMLVTCPMGTGGWWGPSFSGDRWMVYRLHSEKKGAKTAPYLAPLGVLFPRPFCYEVLFRYPSNRGVLFSRKKRLKTIVPLCIGVLFPTNTLFKISDDTTRYNSGS